MNEDESKETIEQEWLRTAAVADITVLKSEAQPTPAGDDWHMVIDGRIGTEDEDDVEWAAFGLIFALGVLSFHDARPRGVSEKDFSDNDDWFSKDMLRNIRFVRGELHFYADYVRGRMLKTTVIVRRDGTFHLQTINRGQAATRWIATLQGKKPLTIVRDQSDPEQ